MTANEFDKIKRKYPEELKVYKEFFPIHPEEVLEFLYNEFVTLARECQEALYKTNKPM